MRPAAVIVLVASLLAACSGEPDIQLPPGPGGPDLTSEPLADGTFPVEFTCDGDDISPPLEWSNVPDDAVELILSLTDNDAPGEPFGFVHWVVYGIDPADGSVQAGQVPAGGVEGENDFGRVGYDGPCPPRGETHEYTLTLTSSVEATGLGQGATLKQVFQALDGPGLQSGYQLGASYGR